jgi:RNA-directed DNA polymerase
MQNTANVTERITEWHSVNWRNANRHIRNLRRRIFKATQLKNSNVLLSVRKVTQENKGKRTRGVDRVLIKTPHMRGKMVDNIIKDQDWKPKPAKRVFIPKSNGKKRPLGIPTIRDRCLQAIVKNALEPCWEAQFEGVSYGFRPGRSVHDAIGKIYLSFRPNKTKKWILDADIKGCFDNINHDKLLSIIGNFPARKLIQEWLKAGYMDKNVFHAQENGTPQGGVISPLLANIALDGLEKAIGVKYNAKGEIHRSRRILIRYADDFVIGCESKEDAEITRNVVNTWLRTRGLELSIEKTRITHITEGFDFLGFNIRHYKVKNTKTGYKLLIKPNKEFLKQTRKDLREIFLVNKGKPVGVIIGKINPVIRGKANYLNKVVSSKAFRSLDNFLFYRQVRYVKRTHPCKSTKWTKNKYWGNLNLQRPNDNWVFGDKKTGNMMLKFSWFKIERHALIVKRSSPDDPNLKEYWEKRRNSKGKDESKRLNKLQQKVADKQQYQCPICGESLFNDEPIHLHHIIPRCEGGRNEAKNLVWLHLYCHHKVHYQKE